MRTTNKFPWGSQVEKERALSKWELMYIRVCKGVSLSPQRFAYCYFCLLGEETKDQHLSLPERRTEWLCQHTLRTVSTRSTCSACKNVYHASGWLYSNSFCGTLVPSSLCLIWNNSKYTVQFGSVIAKPLISIISNDWPLYGFPNTSTKHTKHQTQPWSSN